MTTTRRLVTTYLALMIAAIALYFLSPSVRWLAVSIIGFGSAGAIVTGLRRYRPQAVGPWLMLAAALLLNAIARLVYDALPGQAGVLKPWAWIVWTLHLVMAVLLIGGIVGMAKTSDPRRGGRDRRGDHHPRYRLNRHHPCRDPLLSPSRHGVLQGGVRTAYVLRDALILAAALLLVTAVRRSTSVVLLFVGLSGLLSYDLAFRVGRLRGTYLAGTAIDVGWLLFFVAIGAAALVPSMVATDASRRVGEPEVHTASSGPRCRRRPAANRPARQPSVWPATVVPADDHHCGRRGSRPRLCPHGGRGDEASSSGQRRADPP